MGLDTKITIQYFTPSKSHSDYQYSTPKVLLFAIVKHQHIVTTRHDINGLYKLIQYDKTPLSLRTSNIKNHKLFFHTLNLALNSCTFCVLKTRLDPESPCFAIVIQFCAFSIKKHYKFIPVGLYPWFERACFGKNDRLPKKYCSILPKSVAFFIFFKFNLPSTLANANNCATVKSFPLAMDEDSHRHAIALGSIIAHMFAWATFCSAAFAARFTFRFCLLLAMAMVLALTAF